MSGDNIEVLREKMYRAERRWERMTRETKYALEEMQKARSDYTDAVIEQQKRINHEQRN